MPNQTQTQTQTKNPQAAPKVPASQSTSENNAGKPGFENEGEGNKTAARRYNQATEQYSKSGRAETAANEAKEALEGPEGDELREAEEAARATEPGSIERP
jgi:hypothetical protein